MSDALGAALMVRGDNETRYFFELFVEDIKKRLSTR